MPSEMSLILSTALLESYQRGQPQIGPIFSARPLWPWLSHLVAWHCICGEEEERQYQGRRQGGSYFKSSTEMKRQEAAGD